MPWVVVSHVSCVPWICVEGSSSEDGCEYSNRGWKFVFIQLQLDRWHIVLHVHSCWQKYSTYLCFSDIAHFCTAVHISRVLNVWGNGELCTHMVTKSSSKFKIGAAWFSPTCHHPCLPMQSLSCVHSLPVLGMLWIELCESFRYRAVSSKWKAPALIMPKLPWTGSVIREAPVLA